MAVYVTAQVVSAVINASVSKMFPLVGGWLLIICGALASACYRMRSSHSEDYSPQLRVVVVPPHETVRWRVPA
jgi:hypothetical protein